MTLEEIAAKAKADEAAKAEAEKAAAAAAIAKSQKAGERGKKARSLAAFDDDGDEEQTRGFTVIGPAKGRRRAGFQFGKEPVEVEMTLAQYQAVIADPELSVQPA